MRKGMDAKLSLSWEAYQKSICSGLSLLQQKGEFVDMTLAADGHHVKVHQMVLSLVSPFIKDLITSANCSHPVIFLNKVSYGVLQSILEYAYTGQVLVARENLASFLETCKELHIKGLEGDNLQIRGDDGDLLHLFGARGGEDPEYPEIDGKPPVRIAFKRRKVEKQSTEVEESETHDEYTHDDSFQMDDNALDDVEESIVPVVQKPSSTVDPRQKTVQSAPMVQYSLSCQGHVQLILNRYIYCMRHLRKNNERMWRCVDYKPSGCNATAVTKDDVIVFRGRAHNHPFHDRQILKRVHNSNIYTTFKTVQQLSSFNKKVSAAKKGKGVVDVSQDTEHDTEGVKTDST